MKRHSVFWPLVLVFALAIVGCGKGGGGEKQATASKTPPPALPAGDVPLGAKFASAGLTVVGDKPFPAQLEYRKAQAVTYRTGDGKSGGLVIVQGMATEKPGRVVWHWYFADGVPDSAAATEINGDGLWDVRVYMHGGGVRDFVQGESFTLMAAERDDRVAQNGDSSDPDGVWRCFDGDTTTVWEGKAGVGSWLAIPAPLGIEDGILRIRLAPGGQPQRIAVEADGKKVEDVDLGATAKEQLIEVSGLRGAHSARLLVASMRGSGPARIAELGVR